MDKVWAVVGVLAYLVIMFGVVFLARWADARAESQCTGACNQGRNCDCMPPP